MNSDNISDYKIYGGDGKPRIRKVTATLTADMGEGKELLP
jgi:hypothetical protein